MSPKILKQRNRLIAWERVKLVVCVILSLVAVAGWKEDAFFMLWWTPAAIAMVLAIDLVSLRISGGWERWFDETPWSDKTPKR